MREYYAAKTIGEALDRTTMLLWPPRRGVWLRIAIIALFLGGGMINPIRTDSLNWSGAPTGIPGPSAISGYMSLILTILAGLLIAGLIYIVISSIFQFIFVDCLSSGKILLTRTLRLRWRKGMHLVGFYIILLIIILFCTFVATLTIMVPVLLSKDPGIIRILLLLIETLVVLLIILIPIWVLAILTADFVVPVMIEDDSGILTGWRQVITIFQGRWIEAGIYIALKLVLITITGIILGMVIFLISIPLGITNAVLNTGSGWSPDITPIGILCVGLGTAAMLLISLLLLVPVITFFRYYSLAVLRDLDSRYTLLPEYQLNRNPL